MQNVKRDPNRERPKLATMSLSCFHHVKRNPNGTRPKLVKLVGCVSELFTDISNINNSITKKRKQPECTTVTHDESKEQKRHKVK